MIVKMTTTNMNIQRNKQLFGQEARAELAKGVQLIAQAVKVTLGAGGRNVVIGRDWLSPHITKDGVTVARAFFIDDPIHNMGATLIREVAQKTVDLAGDGTTTATVLAEAMILEGIKAVEAGANPMELKRDMEYAVSVIVEELKKLSKPVDSEETLKQIATISANNDSYIGELVAGVVNKVGKDGLITVEESKSHETYVTLVEGMEIDRGFKSPYFVNDPIRGRVELVDPLILLSGKRIAATSELMSTMEVAMETGRPLLIICDEIDERILGQLVVAHARGSVKLCVIKAPGFGHNRSKMLEDIAIMTGGIAISEDVGLKLENVSSEQLGQADKVIVTKDSCTIVGGRGLIEEIEQRCEELRYEIGTSTSPPEVDKLKERLSKLTNKAAVLSVGGVTETEIKEKKDRIEDALCATKAANDEGYVAGGGATFRWLANQYKPTFGDNSEGAGIITKAMRVPEALISENAGLRYMPPTIGYDYGVGFNVKTDKNENLLDSGIIDPTKVLRVSLENAASIAGIFLTTECLISRTEEYEG